MAAILELSSKAVRREAAPRLPVLYAHRERGSAADYLLREPIPSSCLHMVVKAASPVLLGKPKPRREAGV